MKPLSKDLKNVRKFFDQYTKAVCKNKIGRYDCCRAIFFSSEEKERMHALLKKQGIKEPPMGKGERYCEYLTKEGKCSVYAERPISCRGYGQIKEAPRMCPGCKCTKIANIPPQVGEYIRKSGEANHLMQEWIDKGEEERSKADVLNMI